MENRMSTKRKGLTLTVFEDTYEVINISNHMIEARGFYG